MTKRHNRMMLVGLLVSGVFLAGYLGIKAFSENLLYFYTPSDIMTGKAPSDKSFRVGGLVENGSLERDGMLVKFSVTDNLESIEVYYEGILPDLFREGQGVVASGSIDKEFTEVAVIACFSPFDIAEIMLTVEAIPRIEVKKLFFNSGSSI